MLFRELVQTQCGSVMHVSDLGSVCPLMEAWMSACSDRHSCGSLSAVFWSRDYSQK